jgi:hypothetical protein
MLVTCCKLESKNKRMMERLDCSHQISPDFNLYQHLRLYRQCVFHLGKIDACFFAAHDHLCVVV